MVRRVRGRVAGLEIDLLDRAAGGGQLRRPRPCAARRAGGQHDPQRPIGGVPAGDGQRDVGRAAEQQQGLGRAQGVEHEVLLELEPASQVGGEHAVRVDRRRTRRKSSSRGYIWRNVAAPSRESLAR